MDRNEARRGVLRARAASLAVFAAWCLLTGASLVLFGWAGPLLAVLLVLVLVVSPAGVLASALTIWAGAWVSSCPNCPEFEVKPLRLDIRECAGCGGAMASAPPLFEERFSSRPARDPPEHYCSPGCSE
jgi:hypothetical protein